MVVFDVKSIGSSMTACISAPGVISASGALVFKGFIF